MSKGCIKINYQRVDLTPIKKDRLTTSNIQSYYISFACNLVRAEPIKPGLVMRLRREGEGGIHLTLKLIWLSTLDYGVANGFLNVVACHSYKVHKHNIYKLFLFGNKRCPRIMQR